MKKSLLALAVLGAFAGAAQAQSAVTVYGSFDAGLRNVTKFDGTNSKLSMSSNGTYNSNRLGFKGVEDLGGGLNAHFVLETGFNTGTGALENAAGILFRRSAYVGLGGSWGSLDLGQQYSVNFKTIGLYDPFSYKYTGIVPLAGQGGLTRLANDIQYTGSFGPMTVRAEYALGEQPGSTGDAATQAIGASYKGGPITVGGAYTQGKRDVDTTAAVNYQDMSNWTIGAAYAASGFRVAAGYAVLTQDASATTDTETKSTWIGGSYNLSPAAQLSLAYYRTAIQATAAAETRTNVVILGGTYALSKRTNFYADIDRKSFTGATPSQSGLSVGINHLF